MAKPADPFNDKINTTVKQADPGYPKAAHKKTPDAAACWPCARCFLMDFPLRI